MKGYLVFRAVMVFLWTTLFVAWVCSAYVSPGRGAVVYAVLSGGFLAWAVWLLAEGLRRSRR